MTPLEAIQLGVPLKDVVLAFEKDLLLQLAKVHRGNYCAIARVVGITPQGLRKKARLHEIDLRRLESLSEATLASLSPSTLHDLVRVVSLKPRRSSRDEVCRACRPKEVDQLEQIVPPLEEKPNPKTPEELSLLDF